MSNVYNSNKYGTNKRLQYIYQMSINGKSVEVWVTTNSIFKYWLHKAIGVFCLARGRNYRYDG